MVLDEAPSRCEKAPGEEEEPGLRVTPPPGLSPTPSHQEVHIEEQRLQFLVRTCKTKIYSIMTIYFDEEENKTACESNMPINPSLPEKYKAL